MSNAVLKIRNIFVLSDGATVIACDRPSEDIGWSNRKVIIASPNGDREQELIISGQRMMSRQSAHSDQIALETMALVALSDEEAQSGKWVVRV